MPMLRCNPFAGSFESSLHRDHASDLMVYNLLGQFELLCVGCQLDRKAFADESFQPIHEFTGQTYWLARFHELNCEHQHT